MQQSRCVGAAVVGEFVGAPVGGGWHPFNTTHGKDA